MPCLAWSANVRPVGGPLWPGPGAGGLSCWSASLCAAAQARLGVYLCSLARWCGGRLFVALQVGGPFDWQSAAAAGLVIDFGIVTQRPSTGNPAAIMMAGFMIRQGFGCRDTANPGGS